MFLEVTRRRNSKLIEAGIYLHQNGLILPDTYVLDLDMIIYNAQILKKKADDYNIDLFYMTKQFGRNPLVAKYIHELGISKLVVVDFKEALLMMDQNIPIGNVGHLVQVPQKILEKIIDYEPEFITVFSLDMLREINNVANKLNKYQKVLLKVIEPTDEIYSGQFGGFHLEQLESVIKCANQLDNILISGITSFPCFLYDGKEDFKFTSNVKTVLEAKDILLKNGIKNLEINLPSATCTQTIPMIKSIGGTQGEPGHALTGTTPLHAYKDLDELPSMIYVSEISHNLNNKSYFYGGGYYRRGHMNNTLIFDHNKNYILDEVEEFPNDSIDYYLACKNNHERGSTVISAFRTQIFDTRSDVAVVSGINTGNLRIEGIYNSLGYRVQR